MLRLLFASSALIAFSAFASSSAFALTPGVVEHRSETINGVAVDTYEWPDSQGLARTVSLKKQGAGNSGNGGYAVQVTYQYRWGSAVKTVRAKAPNTGDGGFGYFVGHERYRDFSDGSQNTIAGKIFGTDDSPLGRGFPAKVDVFPQEKPSVAVYRATIQYPRYGTVKPNGYDDNGSDFPRLSLNKADYARFVTPVSVSWIFEAGRDYPRIRTRMSLAAFGPDQTSFDMRGPMACSSSTTAAATT